MLVSSKQQHHSQPAFSNSNDPLWSWSQNTRAGGPKTDLIVTFSNEFRRFTCRDLLFDLNQGFSRISFYLYLKVKDFNQRTMLHFRSIIFWRKNIIKRQTDRDNPVVCLHQQIIFPVSSAPLIGIQLRLRPLAGPGPAP